MNPEDDTDPSIWEQFTAEAVPPWVLEVGHLRITVSWPDVRGVAELDDLGDPFDVLDALLPDDLADEVLDELADRPRSSAAVVAESLRGHFALDQRPPPGGWSGLVGRIDRYGEAIESDLSDRGHDILDWFRGRRPWAQLVRLIDHLPAGSRYTTALLDDDELARRRVAAGVEPPRPSRTPPLLGETADRALLRAILGALRQLGYVTVAVHAGSKAGSAPAPLPGPETAEDRARREQARVEFDELAAHFTGDLGELADPEERPDTAPLI